MSHCLNSIEIKDIFNQPATNNQFNNIPTESSYNLLSSNNFQQGGQFPKQEDSMMSGSYLGGDYGLVTRVSNLNETGEVVDAEVQKQQPKQAKKRIYKHNKDKLAKVGLKVKTPGSEYANETKFRKNAKKPKNASKKVNELILN